MEYVVYDLSRCKVVTKLANLDEVVELDEGVYEVKTVDGEFVGFVVRGERMVM